MQTPLSPEVAAAAVCKSCEEPLIILVEDDDDELEEIPDDLQLVCGCHFHWQCLVSNASQIVTYLICPSCSSSIASINDSPSGLPSPANSTSPTISPAATRRTCSHAIIANYTNEDGFQEGFDIFPVVVEETYLETHPDARPAVAVHILASEGDTSGIIDLIRDFAEDDTSLLANLSPFFSPGLAPTFANAPEMARLLRFQNPLEESQSALHVAVHHGHEDVVWLLLWVASALPASAFPHPVLDLLLAQKLGRLPVADPATDDIRALQDEHGMTAESVAVARGTLGHLVSSGILSL